MNVGPRDKLVKVLNGLQDQLDLISESQAEIVSEVTQIREAIHKIKNLMTPMAEAASAYTQSLFAREASSELDRQEIVKLHQKLDAFLVQQAGIMRRLTGLEEGGRYGKRE